MTEQEFRLAMDDDFEFEPETFTRGVALADLPVWDSMQRLVFIAKAEERTGIVVEGTTVGNAETVDDLLDLISAGFDSDHGGT